MAVAPSDIILLPQVTVQADIQSVIDDVRQNTILAEDVWISCYSEGKPSVHGKAGISLAKESEGGGLLMEGRDGITATTIDRYTFEVSCPALGIQGARVRAPKHVYGEQKVQVIPKAIQAFDISPNGQLFATGFDNGSISIFPTSTSAPPKTSKPHASEITSLRFFPSNEVILASSLDMSVSIISATDPTQVPRRFKGHSRSVTDTAILERGKNVVSCAKDGTVRLWDVGGDKQIKVMGVEGYSPILKMACGPTTTSTAPYIVSEAEVGTEGKQLVCALQSGQFTIIDLGSKSTTFTSTPQSNSRPLHAIAYHPDKHYIATGSGDGVIKIYDTRSLEAGPLHSVKRSGGCIEDLTFTDTGDLLVATFDGLPFRLNIGADGPYVAEELAGVDCDPVRVVRALGERIWTAGDDGLVRCY